MPEVPKTNFLYDLTKLTSTDQLDLAIGYLTIGWLLAIGHWISIVAISWLLGGYHLVISWISATYRLAMGWLSISWLWAGY